MSTKKLHKNSVFVFGSNLAGRHGKGAALDAKRFHGAIYGQGFGPQGRSYAIPTKDADLNALPLDAIKYHVDMFLKYAQESPSLHFKVTAIGTGLAGYSHDIIAPMFKGVSSNCDLPLEWAKYNLQGD